MKTKTLIILSIAFTILVGYLAIFIIINQHKEIKELTQQVQSQHKTISFQDNLMTADIDSYFKYITKLNVKNVYFWLIYFKVKEPQIVLKQSLLETGHYTSRICIENNNIFGFRNSTGYYRYSTWIESIVAYKMWQDRVYDEYSHKNYYQFLVDIGYAEDKAYVEKLKRM